MTYRSLRASERFQPFVTHCETAELTLAAFESRCEQLEDPTHLLDFLDNAGSDERSADLNS